MSRPTSTSFELAAADFLDANLFTDLAQGEESFEAIAEGTVQPAEPDVGIMSPYCEDVAVIYRGVDLLDALTEKARERAENAVESQHDRDCARARESDEYDEPEPRTDWEYVSAATAEREGR